MSRAFDLRFFFLLLVSLSYALSVINIEVLAFLRLSEIIMFVSFFLLFLMRHVRLPIFLFLISSIFLFLYLASSFIGLSIGGVEYERIFVFGYKYSFVIIVFVLAFVSFQLSVNSLLFYKLFYWIFCFLIFWAFFYVFYILPNSGGAISYRLSFPTNDFTQTDAHLYSFVLSFLSLFYILVLRIKLNHNDFFAFLLVLVAVVASLLTGSRTGFFLIILLCPLYFILSFKFPKLTFFNVVMFFLIFFVLAFFVYLNFSNISNFLFSLSSELSVIERVFTSSDNDQSSMSRIIKLLQGVGFYLDGTILFGVGPSYGTHIWYDGTFTMLLLHFGPFGVFLYFCLFVFISIRVLYSSSTDRDKLNCFLLILYVFIALLITEYVLVSRGAFLVLFPLAYYYCSLVGRINIKVA